ncbi:glycosyltransferase [bacterium]|nr:glycosyltransferase [bacterium]
MQIHQLVHTLNYGDAISGEALSIKRLLKQRGIKSEIYCLNRHPQLLDQGQSISDLAELSQTPENEIVMILHYSLASALNDIYRSDFPGKRVLIYHNLTPAEWFDGYNPRVYRDLVEGRAELPGILSCSDLVLADSSYNASEILKIAQTPTRVLPLLFDQEKWSRVEANPGIYQALKAHGGQNILHVGRLAPNKCIEDIIKAFYFYHHKINRQSRLWLVGIEIDTEIYALELRRLISKLALTEAVELCGSVADSELRAFYQAADCYVCMSEHEGFCMPLLEAMYFGLPVIAFNSTAVAETLGTAGLLVAEKNPALLSELFNLVITDSTLRDDLIARGKERAKNFSLQNFDTKLDTELLNVINSAVSSNPATKAYA